ncbi:MAG: helix-turn-helix domain containing protein [Myxococcota bacterium]|jgi:TetR/AcrR family transcriptional regulator, transcriptional repressor for nem operon|nr:helix-turn-helix domain containing protein [Myxococcota bacterium]
MARPVEFDRDAALEAAMRLFWAQGYLATSVEELLKAMGIARSSLYAAFGDKRSLFVEVLRLFSDRTRAMFTEAWAETESLEAVPRFFRTTLLEVPRRRAGRGCLMVNTILELAEVDAGLSGLATKELARVEAAFTECFSRAQAAGEYPTERSAEALAAHLMLVNQGLRVASRKRTSPSELGEQIDTALSLLELPGVP